MPFQEIRYISLIWSKIWFVIQGVIIAMTTGAGSVQDRDWDIISETQVLCSDPHAVGKSHVTKDDVEVFEGSFVGVCLDVTLYLGFDAK